jgi:hypothetical protein
MTALFNRRFGLSITFFQIGAAMKRYGIRNGRDCRFHPGQIPPIGSERIKADGYVEVRIRNPTGKPWKNWKCKHRIIWEAAHGKIPRGQVVLFADGNKLNFSLDNLLLVSRRELAVMNSCNLISGHGELTRAGKAVADIKLLIADRRRGIKKRKRPRAAMGRGGL